MLQTLIKSGGAVVAALLLMSLLTPVAAQITRDNLALRLVTLDEQPRRFKKLEFYFTGGKYRGQKFSYRLYVPVHVDVSKKYPLLLWFHGFAEAGFDNAKNLKHIDKAVNQFVKRNGPYHGFVLIPQVPEGDWFVAGTVAEDDMLTVTWSLLKNTIADFSIDEERITLSGVCSGGTACWEFGMRHPGQFAAIAPLVTGGADESRAMNLVGTPNWAFHNMYDELSPIEPTRRMIGAIQAAGGTAKLTEVPNIGHAAWDQAFRDYHVLDWLLARQRGETNWLVFLPSVTWPYVAACCLVIPLGLFSVHRLWRRSKTRAAQTRSYSDAALPDFSALIRGSL